MKERFRKQKFLRNVGLLPNKNPRSIDQEDDNLICERLCFYYFDDQSNVVCRGCYKSFETWLNFRKHFNTPSCHITETNYKLNTYNDVYKQYKLKGKTTKRIKNRLSTAQLMDLETLNTRKTRKRCYTNTRVVVNNSKSSSDSSGSFNSEKTITVKKNKKDICESSISSDESVVETKLKITDSKTVQDIPDSTNTNIPNLPHDNQLISTIKTEWNINNISQVTSDVLSISSARCISKYRQKENKADKYQYVCVICDERFSNKCSLTMHQVQHIKSDRSSYVVFMAALTHSV